MFKNVLSPWAEIDAGRAIGINERVKDLNGCRIGLFAHFKQHSLVLLEELQARLAERYPTAAFTTLQYTRECVEIENDPEFQQILLPWLKNVDTVVAAYGDMGSCALFLSYNLAYIERQGVPVVMLCDRDFYNTSRRGADARLVSGMRIVTTPMHDLSFVPSLDESIRARIVRPAVESCLDELIAALTEPLTEAERIPVQKDNGDARLTFEGSYDEINRAFYLHGWTDGSPIVPPTEEAVEAMLRGTDLPRDHVVGRLPPRLGLATVEKIAVNGVMAGCLPTYMPVLIAIVKAMLDPRIQLEGYTCSRGSWGPVIILNGPIRHAVHINSGAGLLSPYDHASTTIARAMGLMIMNLSGVRPKLEDLCGMGHIGRFGTCIAENEEDSPWPSLQTDFGFDAEDSTVTLFWPTDTFYFRSRDAEKIPPEMCQGKDNGFDPGCGYILCPEFAKTLANAGWSKKKLLDYIFEYNRRPASQVPIRWLRGNHHVPEDIPLPMDPGESCRSFWTQDHMFIMVGGEGLGAGLLGGGDHGGPSCARIDLPAGWDDLAADYKDFVPHYVNY